MRRADRRRWAACRSFEDVAEVTCAWLAGDVAGTPVHDAPVQSETARHVPGLITLNRAGFVTVCSESGLYAGCRQPAAVWGFARSGLAGRLAGAAEAAGLRAGPYPAGRREILAAYGRRCPDALAELRGARFLVIEDPVPGRDLLWEVLRRAGR